MLLVHSNASTTPLQGSQIFMVHASDLETLHECYSTVPDSLKGIIMDCIHTISKPSMGSGQNHNFVTTTIGILSSTQQNEIYTNIQQSSKTIKPQ
jgi:hypothetical protein